MLNAVVVCVCTFIFIYLYVHNMVQGVTTGRCLIQLGMTHTCNASTSEAEAEGLLWTQCQPGPQSKTCFSWKHLADTAFCYVSIAEILLKQYFPLPVVLMISKEIPLKGTFQTYHKTGRIEKEQIRPLWNSVECQTVQAAKFWILFVVFQTTNRELWKVHSRLVFLLFVVQDSCVCLGIWNGSLALPSSQQGSTS